MSSNRSKPTSSFVTWNREMGNGWAIAYPERISKDTITMLLSYADNKFIYCTDDFRANVAKGEIFIVEPNEVLEFLATQLLRFGKDAPKSAIQKMLEAAEDLVEWKETQNETN